MATFEAFGDSSLNLILRCYISMANMSSRLSIVDELHTRIDLAFREAGIETIMVTSYRIDHQVQAARGPPKGTVARRNTPLHFQT